MKKILVIEDETSYLTLMSEQFTRAGHQVLKADNGKEGLALALAQHPDLILLDLSMPVMDGFAFMEELRKDSYGKSAKIVILTNLDPTKEILKKILDSKPALYLVKSNIRLSELTDKVKSLLE